MATFGELASVTDDLADDDLAGLVTQLEGPVRDVVLALWRRVRGEQPPAQEPEPEEAPEAPEAAEGHGLL